MADRDDAPAELPPLRGPWLAVAVAWVAAVVLLHLAVRELGFFVIL